jgi:subtilisin
MRRRLVVGGMLAALLVSVMAAMPSAAAASSGTGSYIVVLKDSASPSTTARAHAGRFGARVGHVYRHALKGYSATLSSDRVAALKADPSVAAVAPDLPVHAFVQTTPTGINRIDGELSSTVSGNGSGTVNADIAIIDTGIQLNQP